MAGVIYESGEGMLGLLQVQVVEGRWVIPSGYVLEDHPHDAKGDERGDAER